jgi:hypothetical protein
MQGQVVFVFVAHAFVLLSAHAHGVADAASAKFAADVAVFVASTDGPCATQPGSSVYCPKVGSVRRLRRRTPQPVALPSQRLRGTAPSMAGDA